MIEIELLFFMIKMVRLIRSLGLVGRGVLLPVICQAVGAINNKLIRQMRLGLTKSLKLSDVFGLEFMTFAFYLGADNIIFPPMAGFMAGEHLLAAMCDFLLTAVACR